MKSFNQFIQEAGQAPGKMELVRINLRQARAYAEKTFMEHGRDLDEEIPNFDKNFQLAQNKAKLGKTQRKDMPVIDQKDVRDFQRRLKDGFIDINRPFSPDTEENGDPFPEGLRGVEAQQWLEAGLAIYDGDDKDDRVKVHQESISVGDLNPIQKQIYYDKSIDGAAQFGVEETVKFLTSKSFFIVSADNYIIDGHHRMLSGMLIDPKIRVQALVIELPISQLLPLSLAYGDAVGNKRNL